MKDQCVSHFSQFLRFNNCICKSETIDWFHQNLYDTECTDGNEKNAERKIKLGKIRSKAGGKKGRNVIGNEERKVGRKEGRKEERNEGRRKGKEKVEKKNRWEC